VFNVRKQFSSQQWLPASVALLLLTATTAFAYRFIAGYWRTTHNQVVARPTAAEEKRGQHEPAARWIAKTRLKETDFQDRTEPELAEFRSAFSVPLRLWNRYQGIHPPMESFDEFAGELTRRGLGQA